MRWVRHFCADDFPVASNGFDSTTRMPMMSGTSTSSDNGRSLHRIYRWKSRLPIIVSLPIPSARRRQPSYGSPMGRQLIGSRSRRELLR